MESLKADIDEGLADLAEGRVQNFDAQRIIERGREEVISRPLGLHITEAAETDLAEIWVGIAIRSTDEGASRLVAAIEAAFRLVRHFPVAAPAHGRFGPGLRVMFHSHYAIYYKHVEDAAVIIRVLHGARGVAVQGRFAE